MNILCPSWKRLLSDELNKDYIQNLSHFLDEEEKSGKEIYPPREEIFSALEVTPLEKVRVVILGQDPYHGPGQAHGLAFSVKPGIAQPPSLKNIFKELESDQGISLPSHGNLSAWAKEGVLLLNTVLTVEKGNAGSHQGRGWEKFTDKIVELLNHEKDQLVFILWGAPAQKKARNVDNSKHYIISSPHPSPLSCYRGFFGSRPFGRTNDFFREKGLPLINWNID